MTRVGSQGQSKKEMEDDLVFLGYNAASLGNHLPADAVPYPRRTVLSATMMRKIQISFFSVAISIL
jgi:hypothetical protein